MPPELFGLRILIVDDEADTREMLGAVLKTCGVEVKASNSAKAGLEIVEQWRPDLLLCDIAMPEEDGCWLIGRMRAMAQEHGRHLPAVALTAYVSIENRALVLEAGFDMFVPKPVNPSELLAVIVSLLAPA